VDRFQVPKPSGIAIGLIVGLLLALAASAALAARTNAPSKLAAAPEGPAASACTLTGPREGLELNTVVVGQLFKTVAMEKELFKCGPAGTTQVTQQRDVETFIELVENTQGQLVQPVLVMRTICVMDPPTGKVTCTNTNVPSGGSNPTPLKGCQPGSFATPDDPVEMDTAVTSGIAKTIKVDKSWYTCDTPQGPRIQDVYVFNEVLEQRNASAPGLKPFARKTIGIVCTKDQQRATITACTSFPT